MKRIISVKQIPNPVDAPLSVGVQHGRLVSVCGMAPIAPDKSLVGIGDVRAQTKKVMENIALVLADAGGTLADVVKTTVFLADITHYEQMNSVYETFFEGGTYPARSTLGVQLGHPDLLVEIEAWAVVPEQGATV